MRGYRLTGGEGLGVVLVGVVLFAATFWFVWQKGYFADSGWKQPPAVTILGGLRTAEQRYREMHGRYASLAMLRAEGSGPVGEGEVEPSSGYRFASTAEERRYIIVASPPKQGMPAYTLDTGMLRR